MISAQKIAECADGRAEYIAGKTFYKNENINKK
jgi:hypothetical protein